MSEKTTEKYNPASIETQWQARWDEDKLYRSEVDWTRPKHYAVTMLPYPSGDLHIGHWFAMTPSDARARWMRMKGFNVLFPMGFDAFGLPAEQAAISRGVHPWKWTYSNIERMRKQLRSMGTMFDWEREMVSCTPEYYKWTQWFFREFYEKGLAYRGEALVNWSDALQTVLANEQVIDGRDERLGQPVVQKMMTQWFFRYTRYADEMLSFEGIDWPEPIKIMQTNWIGRSEGALVRFPTDAGDTIAIFTTRPDTLWGATFMVLSPEHPLVDKITTPEQQNAVKTYQAQAAKFTEIERTSEDREKTGVFTGGYAINPVSGAHIPVWIADYVMINYGTGAIMAVPYGDQRDFEFARKFGLEIIAVVQPEGSNTTPNPAAMPEAYAGPGVMVNSGPINGVVHNGEKGRKSPSIAAAIDYLQQQGAGEEKVNFRLRDWLIGRQRYWGGPIPIVYNADGSTEAVPFADLPVELPSDVEMKPYGNPLNGHEKFVNAGNGKRRETDTMDTFMCSSWYFYRYLSPHNAEQPFDAEEAAYWLPVDVYTGGAEHATMHLLYARWFAKAMRDLGIFDNTLDVMRDNGRDTTELMKGEPFLLMRNQGQVLGAERQGDFLLCSGRFVGEKLVADRVEVVEWNAVPAGFQGVVGELMKRVETSLFVGAGSTTTLVEVTPQTRIIIPRIQGETSVNQLKHHLEIQRMSKSKGNVVNPDELVQKYGADTVRAYLMFGFDWTKGGPWNDEQISGVVRWLNEVWEAVNTTVTRKDGDAAAERQLERKVHQIIEKVSNGLEKFSFNTAIAGLMELKNELRAALRAGNISRSAFDSAVNVMLRLMAPFTPHVAEELWQRAGYGYSIHKQDWPQYDAAKAKEDTVALVVMINGKPRETIDVPADIAQADAEAMALASDSARKVLNGNAPQKIIFIPGRKGQEPKVNIVVAQ